MAVGAEPSQKPMTAQHRTSQAMPRAVPALPASALLFRNYVGLFFATLGLLFLVAVLSTRWQLRTSLSLVFLIGTSSVSIAFIFIVLHRRLQRNFIEPLNTVTDSLLKQGSPDALSPAGIRVDVAEIAHLMHACEQFQTREKGTAFSRIARQVSHDIRSPLAVLDTLLKWTQGIPEEQRALLRTAAERIRDIANNLVSQSRSLQQPATQKSAEAVVAALRSEWLHGLVDAVVSEKRHQHEHRAEVGYDPDPAVYGACVRVEAERFRRVLSDLLDNTIAALAEAGRVEVQVRITELHVEVALKDTGRDNGVGTAVTLGLPLAPPPPWFVGAVRLPRAGRIVIVDDDSSVHQLWQRRLSHLPPPLPECIHLSTLDELRRWHAGHRDDAAPTRYLCDYEFEGTQEHGLGCIAELSIASLSILVTSHAEEGELQAQCSAMGLQLLPKSATSLVPLLFEED